MKMPNIAVLPALVTLGNAICGFAAIVTLARAPQPGPGGEDLGPALAAFTSAGLLIFLAMVFDALDGRVARFARATSDFGGQLDSLSDAVSFGAAPALLGYRIFVCMIADPACQRLALVLAAVYFACTLLRLARFNVENVQDEEAHMWFRGLPSPAAAGAVASVAILIAEFWREPVGPQAGMVLVWSMLVMLLLLGVLMVSALRYSHLLNQLIRGRRPLSYVLQILMCIALVWFLQEKALALLFVGYVLSGPVIVLYRKVVPVRRESPPVVSKSEDDSSVT